MAFRDPNIVILETGRAHIRAGIGLYELLKTPSVDIQARAGLRRVGDNPANGSQPVAASSRAASSMPTRQASIGEYIVGKQLDDMLAAGEDLEVVWPFANGEVSDWAAAEALWKHVLFAQLSLRRAQNESPVMHAICPTLSRDVHERTVKIFFERFNVPGYSVVERPLAQMYAANALSGIVIDIDRFKTEVTPVCECLIQHNARVVIPVGSADCEKYLAHLWRTGANPSLLSTLELDGKELDEALIALAQHVYSEGLVKVPSDGETAEPEDEGVTNIAAVLMAGKEKSVIEGANKKKRAMASAAEREREREIAALDLVTTTFRGKEVTLGKERHRMCEPLFDLSLLRDVPGVENKEVDYADPKELYMTVQEAVFTAYSRVELLYRHTVLEGIFVAGSLADARGLGVALQSRLHYYLPQRLDGESLTRLVRVPEYFGEYREKGDRLSAFLGASIVAKIIFQDPNGRNFVTKSDYAVRGPHVIIELCPTLL